MRSLRVVLLAAATAGAGALVVAAPAVAEPDGPPPCGMLSVICNMLPMMPELDHDIDMSKNQPPAPPAEDMAPADPCMLACI